jgi:hypothetical protein
MMLPVRVLVVGSAVVVQFVIGLGLAIAGFAMQVGRHRAGATETPWPLSRKVVAAGGVLLALTAIEFIGLFVAFSWWASNERFA